MANKKDITNMRFGKLTAIKIVGKQKREMLWQCECECGQNCIVRIGNLTHGNTRSCGTRSCGCNNGTR